MLQCVDFGSFACLKRAYGAPQADAGAYKLAYKAAEKAAELEWQHVLEQGAQLATGPTTQRWLAVTDLHAEASQPSTQVAAIQATCVCCSDTV